MSVIIFDTYLDKLVNGFVWGTADLRCAMFEKDTWSPSKSDAVLLDATTAGAIECAASGYARVALGSKVANPDGIGHRELLQAAVMDFGVLGAGTPFDTFVIFRQVTNDANSWMLAAFDVGAHTTNGATPERFIPDTNGLFRVAQP